MTGLAESRSKPSQSELEQLTLEAFHKLVGKEPTPIQKKAYPLILRRRDVLLVAPTGSGKTEAAILPILTHLSLQQKIQVGIRTIYITPLRALNRDIARRVIEYSETYGLKAEVRHGDTTTSQRQKMLLKPPDLLITTPETLAILLTSPKFRLHLRTIEFLVVDELHELMGSKRGSHLSVSLERLEHIVGSRITRIGLSATIGNPDVASRFLSGNKRKAAIVSDDATRKHDVKCLFFAGTPKEFSSILFNFLPEKGKLRSILVFTNTRDETEYIGANLREQGESAGIDVEVHHGSLSKEIREDAEERLKIGKAVVVVCTSSLELGLDIGVVDRVIQIGSPRQSVKLIQRVGRARHRVGETAVGTMLVNKLDDEIEGFAIIERIKENSLESTIIHERPLDVLAHHLTGIALERSVQSVQEATDLVAGAFPFKELSVEETKSCLELLEKQRIIRYDGENFRSRGQASFEYYYGNISMIPDTVQFNVIDSTSRRRVGRLDQVFVGEFGEPGKLFTLRARTWRILSVDDDKREVHVEPMHSERSDVPYWVGELIPVERETSQRVGKLRALVIRGVDTGLSLEQVKQIRDSTKILGDVPDEKRLIVEKKRASGLLVIHSCFGTRVNQTLATIIATILTSKTGYLVDGRSDPYRILLSSVGEIPTNAISEILADEFDLNDIVNVSIIGTHPMNWKIWHVAKRFGIVSRSANYDRGASRLMQSRYHDSPLVVEATKELLIEKYDIQSTNILLQKIRRGTIQVLEREVDDFCPISEPILQYATLTSSTPITVEKSIIDLVIARLENTKHRILCLNCGRWERLVQTKDVPDILRCPKCKSVLISATFSSDIFLLDIVRRKRAGKVLKKDEDKAFRRAWKFSSLIQTFGRKAIMVLSGHGIGVDTAARLLRKNITDDAIYRGVYLTEKIYMATRGFWKD
ncbi:MAG: DEAD/DEAH box helicase [Nitrosopumilus sp.]